MSVSVVIPCYNAAAFLRETLESVFRQTYAPKEIIVIDDGSTDGSAGVAAAFGEQVTVRRQENFGESVARNHGIAAARGEWIAFLDADDLWQPEKLERQIGAVRQAAADVVCVYTDFYFFDGSKPCGDVVRPEHHAQSNCRAAMLCDWCTTPSCSLVRTDVALRVLFPEETRHAEDMIFFARLRDEGRFVRVPGALTGYRRSPSQQTKTRDHMLRSVRSRYAWMLAQGERYSEDERQQVRRGLAAQLEELHACSFWKRENDLALACRKAFEELFAGEVPTPELFRRRLYPAAVMRCKDWVDEARRRWKSPVLAGSG